MQGGSPSGYGAETEALFKSALGKVSSGQSRSIYSTRFSQEQNDALKVAADKNRMAGVNAFKASQQAELDQRASGELQLPEDIAMQALQDSETSKETQAQLGTDMQQQKAGEFQSAAGIINPNSGVQRGGVQEKVRGFGVASANIPAQLASQFAKQNLNRSQVAQGFVSANPDTAAKYKTASKLLASRTPKAT